MKKLSNEQQEDILLDNRRHAESKRALLSVRRDTCAIPPAAFEPEVERVLLRHVVEYCADGMHPINAGLHL